MTVRPSVATVKVTTLGKSSASYKIAFVVEALPVWAYGNFSGFAAADETGKGVGVATMTVDKLKVPNCYPCVKFFVRDGLGDVSYTRSYGTGFRGMSIIIR